jgi:uncharacterized protein
MEPDLLLDEKTAITGLTRQERLPKVGKQTMPRYRYTFPSQVVRIKEHSRLFEIRGDKNKSIGTIETIDLARGEATISHAENVMLTDVHVSESIGQIYDLERSLHMVMEYFQINGLESGTKFKAVRDLLLKNHPDITGKNVNAPLITDEDKLIEQAIDSALRLNDSLLPIQGPPGTGKTFTGAKVIVALLKAGKKIGVTAVSHKVIRGLMKKVYEFAAEEGIQNSFRFVHKTKETQNCPAWLTEVDKNQDAIDAVAPMTVVGATAYTWCQPDAVEKLDFLVVDEAGQMALANVLAAAPSGKNIILLGDPQQLEQPQQGVHPEGADVAALAHLLEGRQTIPPACGIFLGITYRMHPTIAAFTSELYYESRLHSKPGLEVMALSGSPRFKGAGLFFVPVDHSGRQTHADEEVVAIAHIVEELLRHASWTNKKGEIHRITQHDILVVAPYNDQVNALREKLPDINIGTVDKFQGQEAAVVIYSVTTSSAADAPRGMEFLYSPNRLNVATSRAMCAVIVVGTEKIFEAECRSIEQMKWVNGFCRYLEMSETVVV